MGRWPLRSSRRSRTGRSACGGQDGGAAWLAAGREAGQAALGPGTAHLHDPDAQPGSCRSRPACLCPAGPLLWDGAASVGLVGRRPGRGIIFLTVASFPAEKLFFSFLIFKKIHSQNETLTSKSQTAVLALVPNTRGPAAGPAGGAYTFPGILARFRAIASSTALSCFSSSSRRDSVLAFPDFVPADAELAGPVSEALPGTLVTLLELLDWGDSWRFLRGGKGGRQRVHQVPPTGQGRRKRQLRPALLPCAPRAPALGCGERTGHGVQGSAGALLTHPSCFWSLCGLPLRRGETPRC